MLRSLLKERNMTLTELSKNTGISLKALSAFQNQRTDGVQYKTLELIAKDLDLDIGDIIKRVDDIYEIKVQLKDKLIISEENELIDIKSNLIFINNSEESRTADLSFSIIMRSIKNINFLEVHINNFGRHGLGTIINELISSEIIKPTSSDLLNIISNLIIQELLKCSLFESLDIFDSVRVSWRKSLFNVLIDNVNADIINYENDRIIHIKQDYDVSLVPLNPDTILIQANIDTSIPYTANIEALQDLPLVYRVDIDPETYHRSVFITLD